MKKNITKTALSLIMLFNLSFLNAQVERLIPADINGGECGTSAEGPVFRFNSSQLNSSKFAINLTNYVFNVKVHYIANNVPTSEQELKALDLVGALNLYYNDAHIYFKYQGFDNIANSTYLDITGSNIGTLYPANTNTIEIYICNTISNPSTTAGVTYSWSIGNTISKKVIALRKDYMPTFSSPTPTLSDFKNYTAIHEVGHYLGLYHTHQQWQFNSTTGQYTTIGDASCGLEESLDNSQCSILGDLICDTNPDRVASKYWGTSASYYSNCTIYTPGYQPSVTCGTSINLAQFNPPMNNIMAYYHLCRTVFSQGQRDYMRAFIDANTNGGFLTNQLNPDGVNSLYEPFAADGLGGPPSTTYYSKTYTPNTTNTGVNIWNCPNIRFRFQKGLNYKFTYPTSSSSTITTTTPNIQYNKTLMSGYTLNIEIPIFGSYAYTVDAPLCFSSYEPYSSGKVESLTNFGSPTITTQPLDQESATDPNLINNLDSQKYHIITKETESGFIDQKVIYKN